MNNQANRQFEANTHPLRSTAYDRAASWLISSLLIAGLAVTVLVVAWFSYPSPGTTRDIIGDPPGPEQSPIALKDAKEFKPLSGGTQLEKPSDMPLAADEIADMDLRRDLAILEASAKNAVQVTGRSLVDGPGIYGNPGPGRGIGDPNGGPIRPPQWEVQFDKTSLAAYARQLDFFKIELGVLSSDRKQLSYASNLTKSKPDTRITQNPHENEERYYLTWRKGDLAQADQALLARAGIDPADGLILKFLPDQLVEQLKVLEKTAAGNDRQVVKTRFGIRTEGDGYALFVLEQTYKP